MSPRRNSNSASRELPVGNEFLTAEAQVWSHLGPDRQRRGRCRSACGRPPTHKSPLTPRIALWQYPSTRSESQDQLSLTRIALFQCSLFRLRRA